MPTRHGSKTSVGGQGGRFVVVAGNIGVGKSSLVTLYAAARPGARAVLEAVDESPYLADFYADMGRWAFPSQVFFLARRMRQHHAVGRPDAGVVLQDRSIYEDAEIFAQSLYDQGALPDREWRTYRDLYEAVALALPPPDAVVYLRASVPTLEARIARRGRDYEKGIPREYLERLNDRYDAWARSFVLAPVVTVETDALDFVERPEDLRRVMAVIDGAEGGRA